MNILATYYDLTHWWRRRSWFWVLVIMLLAACDGRPADQQKLADAIASGDIAGFTAELNRGFSADDENARDGNLQLGLIHVAAAHADENPEFLRILLARKIKPDLRTQNGSTPLMFAAVAGSLEGCRLLLDQGAQVDSGLEAKSRGPMTPLEAAAGKGHLPVVKLLVERGADINRCHPIRSPLLFAKEAGHQEVVDYLISKGARSDTGMSSRALQMLERCR